MTIKEVIDYVMHNPENTNPAVLEGLLVKLIEDNTPEPEPEPEEPVS